MLKNIRSKVLISTIIITFGVTFITEVALYFKVENMLKENYVQNTFLRLEQTVHIFDDFMEEVYYINVKASSDSNIIENMDSMDKENIKEISNILRDYKRQEQKINSLYLISLDENILVSSEEYPIYKKIEGDGDFVDEISNIIKVDSGPVVINDLLRNGGKMISFVQEVYDKENEVLGYLVITIDERTLYYEYLDNLYDGIAQQAVIINENNEIISTRDYSKIGSLYKDDINLEASENGAYSYDRDYIQLYYKSSFSGYEFYITVHKDGIIKDLVDWRNFAFIIGVIGIIITLFVAYFISKRMSRPIEKLSNTMDRVSLGELDLRADIETNDEIGALSKGFNNMLDQIEKLIEQLLIEESLKKDAKLEALQYQITPHFIYNTLNSIKYAALLKGEKELGKLMGDFIELLQACINKKGSFITLDEEIHMLNNYIHLEEFRHNSNINIEFHIDEVAKTCYVPRLILQPLVENSLIHGIDVSKEDSQIIISGKIEEEKLILSVYDNGRGMTKEQLEFIIQNKSKKVNSLTSIGITNIKERLKLYYNDQGKIIYDTVEKGTIVKIYLPAKKEL